MQGRLRYHIRTFGCQMNAHDSERMDDLFKSSGAISADSAEEADVVVFNTCSVREKAEQKLRSEVGKLAPLKLARPELVVVVAGCVAQQEGERLLKRMRLVDLVVGPDHIAELPALVAGRLAGSPSAVRTGFDVDEPRFLPWSPATLAGNARSPVVALVTTMKGCDERCTFCIVPHTRGPERHRAARDIVDEVGRLALAGAREVLLLGQTVNSYRDPGLPPAEGDDPDATQFPHLLRAIDAAAPAGLARLRYTSPHPRHATASLARAHAEIDRLARHVHLPVQSGSDRVLRRMIRRYTRSEYLAGAERLQRCRSGLTLSTDVIVGFPGETEEDFAQTLSLVREVGFVSLFGFKYSPRPFTPATRLGDDVSEETKSERLARLFELAESLGGAHLASLVGSRQRVLVEGPSKSDRAEGAPGGLVQGRTERNEIVHVACADAASLVGRIVEVDIERANRHSLAGTLHEGATPIPPAAPARAVERRVLPVWSPS